MRIYSRKPKMIFLWLNMIEEIETRISVPILWKSDQDWTERAKPVQPDPKWALGPT
ncbi:uncharacterized protein DS421_17g593500 [Arachis hypogaea]|nr:uncharacterized protein DS421_17g593500 [Arachis hypogaea]